MSDPIGFIGLGNLGLPVATNLLDAGYPLMVYNRTASKAAPLVARGAQRAAQPADVATPGGIVVSLLWDGASVEKVVTGAGFLDRLGAGGIHLSMSTMSPDDAKRLAALHADHGSTYVEAPIFGRPEAAAARQLWIPYAGPEAAKGRIRPLLTALGSQGSFDFGEAIGAALIVKLIGNYLISSAARSLGEGLALAEGHGVDQRAVVEMLTSTLFTAPIYRSYGMMIATKIAPTTQNAIGQKDLGIFREMAAQSGTPDPIATLLYGLLSGQHQSS